MLNIYTYFSEAIEQGAFLMMCWCIGMAVLSGWNKNLSKHILIALYLIGLNASIAYGSAALCTIIRSGGTY